MFAFFIGNFAGFSITKERSAVHMTMVFSCKTVVVWSVNLALFYGLGGACRAEYGEDWKGLWSWVQLAGFGAVITGTVVYHQEPPAGAPADDDDVKRKRLLDVAGDPP